MDKQCDRCPMLSDLVTQCPYAGGAWGSDNSRARNVIRVKIHVNESWILRAVNILTRFCPDLFSFSFIWTLNEEKKKVAHKHTFLVPVGFCARRRRSSIFRCDVFFRWNVAKKILVFVSSHFLHLHHPREENFRFCCWSLWFYVSENEER